LVSNFAVSLFLFIIRPSPHLPRYCVCCVLMASCQFLWRCGRHAKHVVDALFFQSFFSLFITLDLTERSLLFRAFFLNTNTILHLVWSIADKHDFNFITLMDGRKPIITRKAQKANKTYFYKKDYIGRTRAPAKKRSWRISSQVERAQVAAVAIDAAAGDGVLRGVGIAKRRAF
jgi:hypothetical protein